MEIIKTVLTFYLWAGILTDTLYVIWYSKHSEEDKLASLHGMTMALLVLIILWPIFVCGVIHGLIDYIFKR